jgi:hypothetical protein
MWTEVVHRHQLLLGDLAIHGRDGVVITSMISRARLCATGHPPYGPPILCPGWPPGPGERPERPPCLPIGLVSSRTSRRAVHAVPAKVSVAFVSTLATSVTGDEGDDVDERHVAAGVRLRTDPGHVADQRPCRHRGEEVHAPAGALRCCATSAVSGAASGVVIRPDESVGGGMGCLRLCADRGPCEVVGRCLVRVG